MDKMVTRLPEQTPRVESGVMQFGDDWPGVFFRGDDALYFAHLLSTALEESEISNWEDYIAIAALQGLRDSLAACANFEPNHIWIEVENEHCSGGALCLETMEIAAAGDVELTNPKDISDEEWERLCKKWPNRLIPRK